MKDNKEVSSILDVFRYEVYMYLYMYIRVTKSKIPLSGLRNRARKNSYVESFMLHTRILSEIFVIDNTKNKDDINLKDILPSEKYSNKLNSLIKRLRKAYGNPKTMWSPRWRLNKMLFHASNLRGISYNYSPVLIEMHELIILIIEEISLITSDVLIKEYLRFYKKSK